MALKLMDPVYNQMPFFQPNQVLTYNHLNDLAAYLYQQERYTRNKLIGSGIVCGLSFSWTAVVANAQVLIDEGCAVTSAGYLIVFKQPVNNDGTLIPYTHKRNFTRLKDIEPFKSVPGISNKTSYELITLDQFNAETDPSKNILLDADKTDRVLILLVDLQTLNVAKCLDESCDDKGKLYDFTPRPLLVPVEVIDAILNANNTKQFFTETGRSFKGKESALFELEYLNLKNLFKNNNLQNINTTADLVNLFKAPCQDIDLNAIKSQIDNLIAKYPWIFDVQFNCLKSEVALIAAQSLGTIFFDKAKTFRDTPSNDNYMQYLYDYLRDMVDAYNELFSGVTDLVGECGGNEFIHPFHVMLGLPQTNDTLACYNEVKYNEHNFKYRNYFVPSPVMDGQFMLYEKVQSLFKRLVRIIANFNINFKDTTIKVTPGKDYDTLLGERALPYFYLKAAAENIKAVWNYDLTRRNKIKRIKGYQLTFTQDELLKEDTSKNDFYRIEGHIGSSFGAVKSDIDDLRNKYNLPFAVGTISIQSKTNTITCTFPDLEEEYSYYRDRVLGYIREILRWLASVKNSLGKNKSTQVYYEKILKAILTMNELLGQKCIDQFKYNLYKKIYALIWDTIFEFYVFTTTNNVKNANQNLNSVLNIFNIIFFRPIYKIWYMYKYRMDALAQSQVTSLKLLAEKITGLEHLAGVRRGETFLLVTDALQGDKVIADFNLPDLPGCGCECKADACNEKKQVKVSPLQKPIIMVVDYSYTNDKNFSKSKAYLDKNHYVLELDSMGFYKADSGIGKYIKVFDENKNQFKLISGTWENEKLVLRYQANENPKNDGVFKLFYELIGNFDEKEVVGEFFLFVIGRVTKVSGAKYNSAVGGRAKAYYPYDKTKMTKVKPEMKFEGTTKRRTVGEEKVDVYTTENGNELAIYKDRSGLPYIKIINSRTPGVEDIPIILETENAGSKDMVTVNIVAKNEKLDSDTISGKILNEESIPVKDVKVSIGDREAITNEKGEYSLAGVKAGDVITVEKSGYKATHVQANSKLDPEIKLKRESLINIPGLEKLNLPVGFENLAERINITALRNILK